MLSEYEELMVMIYFLKLITVGLRWKKSMFVWNTNNILDYFVTLYDKKVINKHVERTVAVCSLTWTMIEQYSCCWNYTSYLVSICNGCGDDIQICWIVKLNCILELLIVISMIRILRLKAGCNRHIGKIIDLRKTWLTLYGKATRNLFLDCIGRTVIDSPGERLYVYCC